MRVLPLVAPLLIAGLLGAADTADTVRFNRDIRPIMSDTCFHCHGFDPKSRKGGLRLDIREDALKAGKSGEIAIVPVDSCHWFFIRCFTIANRTIMGGGVFGKELQ